MDDQISELAGLVLVFISTSGSDGVLEEDLPMLAKLSEHAVDRVVDTLLKDGFVKEIQAKDENGNSMLSKLLVVTRPIGSIFSDRYFKK